MDHIFFIQGDTSGWIKDLGAPGTLRRVTEPASRETAAAVYTLELLGHVASHTDAQKKTETSFAKPTAHPAPGGPVGLPVGEVAPPHLPRGVRAPLWLQCKQGPPSQHSCPPAESSLLSPRLVQFKGTKRTQKATFFRQEMVAFYACQASSEIQNKTHHCEREYEIKGAFITLGSALFEILTFPL